MECPSKGPALDAGVLGGGGGGLMSELPLWQIHLTPVHTETSWCNLNFDIDIKILFSKVDSPCTHATFGVFCFWCTSKVASFRRVNFRKQYFYIDIGVKIE